MKVGPQNSTALNMAGRTPEIPYTISDDSLIFPQKDPILFLMILIFPFRSGFKNLYRRPSAQNFKENFYLQNLSPKTSF